MIIINQPYIHFQFIKNTLQNYRPSLSFFDYLQWCSQFNDVSTSNGKTQIPIRLIVPASQCGSLIGKLLFK